MNKSLCFIFTKGKTITHASWNDGDFIFRDIKKLN